MKLASCLLPVALLSGLGCSKPAPVQVVEETAAQHGEELFHDASIADNSINTYACATCHAATAEEVGNQALPGVPLAGALMRPSYWGGQQLDLLAAINDCGYFFMLKNEPWTKDSVEARALYAYLESLPAGGDAKLPAPFTVVYTLADSPNGDETAGSAVYDRACASCHGAPHTGVGRLVGRALVLPDAAIAEHPVSKYTDAQRRLVFVEKIRHGGFVGYTGQMPPFSTEVLSDEDLGDLFAFFKLP